MHGTMKGTPYRPPPVSPIDDCWRPDPVAPLKEYIGTVLPPMIQPRVSPRGLLLYLL